jgi:hypothetical protein
MVVPSGWSEPSVSGTDPGYTTSSGGSVSTSGQSITVSNLTLTANAAVAITYGSKAASGPGATASTTAGPATWSAQENSTSGGSLTSLSTSPSINVYAPDGSGTLTTATAFVVQNSAGNTITLTYTAATGGLSGAALTIAVPNGWGTPSTSASAPGYTTTSTGTISITGEIITVSGVTLSAGGTLTIIYGSKASSGPGALAPATIGSQTWTAQEKSSSGGTLTNLPNPPTVTVETNGSLLSQTSSASR